MVSLTAIAESRSLVPLYFVTCLSQPLLSLFSPGSPFKFHVDSLSSGYVTAYGPGLVHGITGEPANFTVTTKDVGSGSSVSRGKYHTTSQF